MSKQQRTQINPRTQISAEELRVWRGFIETTSVLNSRLASRMQSESALSTGDYGVLLALREAPGRSLRSSELASSIGWERSRLSHQLGRMEKRGLLRRDPCPEDTRGSVVSLTDEGATAFRRGSVPHLKAIQELFLDALSPEQLAQVASLTDALRGHLGLDESEGGPDLD
ncbi:MarR family winged helix-turn-helix transcriptional regulator [Pseudoclavibacter helvolus]|uniref:DNA-binding MarR family transcriptional regulator n=1 Tax=Pseudoclavibacter helvolus TaxID=255205 RepID=A0A7W4UPH3_9MICO|nr:MarR family transcriptional regulator [Pseudoclavibacter helvolus]MBB2957582.1 DNA-binding MarR family transcriptional regulator [Pseudoclavibacter helvolus]